MTLVEATAAVDTDRHLSDLAVAINEQHLLVETAMLQAVEHATRAGDLLTEARSAAPAGRWTTWLRNNFHGSPRTAQLYMRISHYRAELPGDVSLSEAQRLLSGRERLDSGDWADGQSRRGRKTAAGRRQREQRRLAALALKREQRARAAKKRGGTLASGYSHIRQALDDLERATSEEKNAHCKREIDLVIHRLYEAEDAMKDVLGTDHGHTRLKAAA